MTDLTPPELAQWLAWKEANPPPPKPPKPRPPPKPRSEWKKLGRPPKPKPPPRPQTPGIGLTRVRDLRAICRAMDEQALAHGIPVDTPGGIEGFEKQIRKVINSYRMRQQKLYQQRKPLIILPEGHWIPPVKEARDAGQFPK